MVHKYNRFKSRISYEIDNDGNLSLKEGIIEKKYTVCLKSEKFKISEGFLFLSGINYLVLMYVGLGVFMRLLEFLAWTPEFLFTFFILAFLLTVFVWYKFGIVARGCTIKFENGEKLFIYRGNENSSYDALISTIKSIDQQQITIQQ